jgi:transposase-like protein
MTQISCSRHRVPCRHSASGPWLFTPSTRDVEGVMAQRVVDVSQETVRACTSKV